MQLNSQNVLTTLAERLGRIAPEARTDWSDSWSEADMEDFRAASLDRLDAEESEESGPSA